ncbi:hypothetical protein DNTS_000009 [Danionella cerebrum]|uniref:Uncharacterized protein n=1 Tax=Danionella cerebrum TaxID=2873325 RepID=A0A553QIK2_9TELE|nr:hypothetical protein DNTS_000009 [Danionella translucida]
MGTVSHGIDEYMERIPSNPRQTEKKDKEVEMSRTRRVRARSVLNSSFSIGVELNHSTLSEDTHSSGFM